MAAFVFPNPATDGQEITNDDTGTRYVYKADPGKWVVAMQMPDQSYVNIAGDTMTGPLTVEPANPILESARQASFTVVASPFSQFNDTQNYISRVVEIDTNEGTNILNIRNSDAANLPIAQGKKSSINIHAAETSIFPSLSQVDPPAGGIVAGLKIRGRRADGTGGAAGDIITCKYFESDNTQISYFGDIVEDENLVNKGYVDNAISNADVDLSNYLKLSGGDMSGAINWPTLPTGDALNVNSGNFVVTDTGKVTTKGSLTVQSSNLAVNSGNISVSNGIIDINSSSNKEAALILYDYGNTNPNQTIVLLGMTGKIAMGSELWMYDRTSTQNLKAKNQIYCSSGGSNVPPSYLEIKLGDTREGESDKTPFVATCDGVELTQTTQVIGPFEKTRGTDGTRDFVIYGSTSDNPTTGTEILFGTYRNTLNNTFQPDAIAYFGKTDGEDTIQTKTSVLDLIANNSLPSDPSFTDVTVTNKLQGGANGVAGSLEIDCYNLDVENRFYVPPSLQMFGANTSTTFNLTGSNDSIWFRSDDKLTNSAPTDNITGYLSNAGLALMRPLYMFGGGVAGSDNPNTTGQNCKVEFNNTTSEYAIINKTGYGQNGYQIFAAKSNGTPVKMFNFVLSADGTKGYLNCYFKPQGSNGLVRLADLSTGVVGSINTYSVTGGEEGSDEATYHVSNHNIPGQCTFEGLPNGGSGFQLIGKTQGDPTNSSARLIATSHYSADQAAQIEYFGDTTGTDDCLQTKASVQAMLNDGFTNGTDLLVGNAKAVKGSDGAGPSLSIRNSDDTADVFNVASNGVVTLTNNLYGAHDIKFTGPNLETSSSQLIISALGNNSSITHNVYDANGSPQRVTYMTKDGCNIYKSTLIAAPLNVSNDAGITTSGPLKSTDNTPSGGIILDSGQTTSAIKAIGSSIKNFKIYIGYNANNTQQAFMCSKTQMYFGNGNSAMDYKFSSSDTTIPLRFNDGVSFVLNDAANPITFTQGKITNVGTISTTDSTLTLMFNNTVGGPVFGQGMVDNINYFTTADNQNMYLRALGGTSQQIIFQTSQAGGGSYNAAIFDDTHAKLPGELQIYQNSGATNGKIYSYGFSRGLDFYVADYNTSKGNSKLAARFQASMVSFMTGICFDNTSAHGNNPSTDITIRVGTGAQGAAAAYPKIDFAWATDTGVTYEQNFTMEYTQFTNVPDVVLLSGSHVTQSSAPTNGNHLTNKTYVDNGTTNLTNLFAGIKAGVEAATDFDQLKSNILFALSSIS